ncbi:tyrosine-type recombinase/integrase [uncultured Castellaniella sp.]|uniref:tyrosine-type recombinase/integrase n=1 Tax=uncultured Castellaniella sp. TaxID=647907 RepID=UPI002637AD7D|nr:tyrosine-type recombinase/integrase [uncultured Castellaniella sp.]
MRPRKKDRHLPACVYQRHGAFYYVHKGKWTRLGDDLHTALLEYAGIVAVPENGFPALVDKALPNITRDVSASTARIYRRCAGILKETFAEFRPEQVTHGAIVQMQDMWRERAATGNHLLTTLKLIFQWAMDREIVLANPTLSVKRLPAGQRDRLITWREYQAIYAKAPDWIQVIMDICYLTGQRIGDVLKIEYGHLQDDGIFFEQEKTGKKLVVAWTPELRAVVERARRLKYSIKSARYLLSGRAGTKRERQNVWRHFKDATRAAGIDDVTLHDLRAMSGTEADREGKNATELLGHTDAHTTRIYLRDKAPKTVSGPSKPGKKSA